MRLKVERRSVAALVGAAMSIVIVQGLMSSSVFGSGQSPFAAYLGVPDHESYRVVQSHYKNYGGGPTEILKVIDYYRVSDGTPERTESIFYENGTAIVSSATDFASGSPVATTHDLRSGRTHTTTVLLPAAGITEITPLDVLAARGFSEIGESSWAGETTRIFALEQELPEGSGLDADAERVEVHVHAKSEVLSCQTRQCFQSR